MRMCLFWVCKSKRHFHDIMQMCFGCRANLKWICVAARNSVVDRDITGHCINQDIIGDIAKIVRVCPKKHVPGSGFAGQACRSEQSESGSKTGGVYLGKRV